MRQREGGRKTDDSFFIQSLVPFYSRERRKRRRGPQNLPSNRVPVPLPTISAHPRRHAPCPRASKQPSKRAVRSASFPLSDTFERANKKNFDDIDDLGRSSSSSPTVPLHSYKPPTLLLVVLLSVFRPPSVKAHVLFRPTATSLSRRVLGVPQTFCHSVQTLETSISPTMQPSAGARTAIYVVALKNKAPTTQATSFHFDADLSIYSTCPP